MSKEKIKKRIANYKERLKLLSERNLKYSLTARSLRKRLKKEEKKLIEMKTYKSNVFSKRTKRQSRKLRM